MNALDQFFASVTNEFGEKINFSNIENEGFTGVVCFEDRSADICIDIDSYKEFDNDLSENENMMLKAFVTFTQSEMKNCNFFREDIKKTQWTLF
ncbi:hypothetical protein ACFQO9_11115 [Chryseobacterium zhengzhouense]|uniref:Uncharacterized protein n=1 Tax=Chryseobacterium zhengzhouense TaxID=1636086 RepID=A0ABW2M1K7_9FLAO